MQSGVKESRKTRFRRISRARILDGPVLRPGIYAVSVMVVVYLAVTAIISLLFSYIHKIDFSLVFWALLPGALLGYSLLVLERLLGRMKELMFPQMGKLLTAFLLFFLHTIGYLSLSSLLVSYPLARIMEKFWGMTGIASEFGLFSVNFFIVLAIMSWLRNVRTPPCRCF